MRMTPSFHVARLSRRHKDESSTIAIRIVILGTGVRARAEFDVDDVERHVNKAAIETAWRHGFPPQRSSAPMTAWPRALPALRTFSQGSSTTSARDTDPQHAPPCKGVGARGGGQLHLIRAVGVHQEELLTLTRPERPDKDDLLPIG
jgi:hypothetical protein